MGMALSQSVAVDGRARLCTQDRVPIHVLGAPPRPPAAEHVDVILQLWNKSRAPISVFSIYDAEAAGQSLQPEQPGYIGSFTEVVLTADGVRSAQHVQLRPPKGETLRARVGADVGFRIRTSRGRPRRVSLEVQKD